MRRFESSSSETQVAAHPRVHLQFAPSVVLQAAHKLQTFGATSRPACVTEATAMVGLRKTASHAAVLKAVRASVLGLLISGCASLIGANFEDQPAPSADGGAPSVSPAIPPVRRNRTTLWRPMHRVPARRHASYVASFAPNPVIRASVVGSRAAIRVPWPTRRRSAAKARAPWRRALDPMQIATNWPKMAARPRRPPILPIAADATSHVLRAKRVDRTGARSLAQKAPRNADALVCRPQPMRPTAAHAAERVPQRRTASPHASRANAASAATPGFARVVANASPRAPARAAQAAQRARPLQTRAQLAPPAHASSCATPGSHAAAMRVAPRPRGRG